MTPEEIIEWKDLVGRYLDGEITEDEFADLKEGLRNDSQKRELYLESVKTDTHLREIAGQLPSALPTHEEKHRSGSWFIYATVAAACFSVVALVSSLYSRDDEATIGLAKNVEWLSQALPAGQGLNLGDEVQLISGSVEVLFRSGALTRIHGPARFEITSENSGFLHHGQAWARAETEDSQGFTIHTHSGNFVDRGTEFLTTAKQDGFSQMHVASGAVDVEVEGFSLQRLEKGSGLGIEPGDTPIMIRIEAGAETNAFSFPTIPPPSDSDWADRRNQHSAVSLKSENQKGRGVNLPHRNSGDPRRLIDGQGQSGSDQPKESLFFTDGANATILLDLGREIPVSRIHTYSWHLNDELPSLRRRAVQRYTLWGCRDKKPDTMPSPENANGWSRIARVDTDAFFRVVEEPGRPAQQACSIYSNTSSIGDFRYLLFQVLPTAMPEGKPARHTFFGEIDVFGPNPHN